MATFICKRSGNRVTFTNEVDIEAMRKEESYEEVKEEVIEKSKRETLKLRGKNGNV